MSRIRIVLEIEPYNEPPEPMVDNPFGDGDAAGLQRMIKFWLERHALVGDLKHFNMMKVG